MPDIEKVIKGLECHRIDDNHRINCTDCPYYVDDDNHIRCVNDLHDDALVLLKDQQEQIEQMNYIYGFVYGGQVKEIKKLVRCNECKHRDPEDHKCDCGHDIQWQLPRADDWFCADGEQKDVM